MIRLRRSRRSLAISAASSLAAAILVAVSGPASAAENAASAPVVRAEFTVRTAQAATCDGAPSAGFTIA
ncbi:hypothetical protein [Nocardia sp. NPDC005978]|uniref:hypothetical protein n=1 Tax=unclassified Nocardia TaxID=2637762 RepID=UPI0033A8E401